MPYVFKEIIFAAGSILLAVLFLIESRRLTDSAAMFPRILIGIIILLAILMGIQAVRESRNKKEERPAQPVLLTRLVSILIILVSYVALVEPLGYFIATPLYIFVAYFYLRAVKPVTALAIAVGFPAFIFALFVMVLHLPVPMGLLDGFF